MNKKLRILGFILSIIVVAGIAGYGVKGLIKKDKITVIDDYQAYDEEVIKEAQSIPVQDDGRVKPFQSWASTLMLAMRGERSMKIMVDGQTVKVKPTAWLLDIIFRPEQANKLPTFRVDNSDILSELGMKTTDLRDRYSMNELKPYLAEFDKENKAINQKIEKLDRKSLTLKEKQTLKLFERINIYISLQNPFRLTQKDSLLLEQFQMEHISDVFDYRKKILGYTKLQSGSTLQSINGLDTLASLFNTLARQPRYFGDFSKLPIVPPAKNDNDTWISPGKEYASIASHNDQAYQQYLAERDALLKTVGPLDEAKAEQIFKDYFDIFTKYLDKNSRRYPEHLRGAIFQLENLDAAVNSNDTAKQLGAIKKFKAEYAEMVEQRGEGKMINTEITHNNLNYFNNGLAFIILALLIVIVRCMLIGTKFDKGLYWIAYGVTTVAALYIIAGITHRCIIMQRPPVGNLYDTMPFIVAASLVILLLLELIGKQGILLAVATVLGIGGIVLAKQYEVSQASDNLSPLRAVLKSNYWLTTHVISITLGYVGGLITAMLSVFYILGRVFGILDDKKVRKTLSSIVYGMVAFTLVFSLVGTILGGIWGADSWGRFWGWDPKENGALLIVIWVLAVLHARLGGFIKEMGLHCCGAFTAVIVVFSWWHVNFLGVGLHSYGFTSADAMGALWFFYSTIAVIIILGMISAAIETEKIKMRKHAEEIAKQQEQRATEL